MQKNSKLYLLYLLCMVYTFSNAQINISGTVHNEMNEPVINADVFIANTTIFTKTSNDGSFRLQNMAKGTELILVVSSLDYETFYKNLALNNSLENFQIKLRDKKDLRDVVVYAFGQESWKKWKEIFTRTFIGTGKFADQCKIINPKDLLLQYNDRTKILRVRSKKPLQISNKALGYDIVFDIVNYNYNTETQELSYIGFPYFQDSKGSKKAIKRHKQNRAIAYNGSIMQFIRLLYNHRLQEEGYILLNEQPRKEKIFNPLKARYINHLANSKNKIPKDSLAFYESIKNQPDSTYKLVRDSVSVSEILKTENHNNYLQLKSRILVQYQRVTYSDLEMKTKPQLWQYGSSISGLELRDHTRITIYPNGSYSDPDKLMMSGIWAKTETVSTLLPLDYKE
ncbi:carboxypeptidase-like regulatory domain-containing protein [Haoranjiania flava]